MADEIIFAGGRLDSLTVVSGTPTENTTSGYFNSTYADASANCANGQSVRATFVNSSFVATDVVTGETLWLRWDSRRDATSANSGLPEMTLYDSSGFPWLKWAATGTFGSSATRQLYYNSGSGGSPAWTAITGIIDAASDMATLHTYVLKLTLGSPHSVDFYIDATQLGSTQTFTQASLTSLRSAVFANLRTSTSTNTRFAEIMASRGISLVNSHVKYSRGSASGANSGWTGSVTDVNEAVNSDATYNVAASASLKQSYAMTDVSLPSGSEIATVFHWLRGYNDASAPANIKSLIRAGGTDYSSSNLSGIGVGIANLGERYDTNPNTSSAWTESGFNAIEAGFESAT